MVHSRYCSKDWAMGDARGIAIIRCMIWAAFILGMVCCQEINADVLVIAHPDISMEQLTLGQLSAIYSAKMKTWPDGKKIIPVNREAGSQIRAEFSRMVFREPPEALADYWAKMKFKGEKPPLIQESADGALLFVQRVPGSIAYVDKGIPLAGVKVLMSLPAKPAP